MGAADRGDVGGVARGGEPVADRGPDRAAPARARARRLAGDQQQQPRARSDRALEPLVEQTISGRQIVAVEIEARIGRRQPAREAPVQLPSRVVPGVAFLAGAGAGCTGSGPGAAGAASSLAAAVSCSGRTLSTTLRQSARSSALRRRTVADPAQRATRQQQIGAAARRHRAGDRRRFLARAPKVSTRLDPRIAPPVSCATHNPSARGLSMPTSSTGARAGRNADRRRPWRAASPGGRAAPSGPGPVSS